MQNTVHLRSSFPSTIEGNHADPRSNSTSKTTKRWDEECKIHQNTAGTPHLKHDSGTTQWYGFDLKTPSRHQIRCTTLVHHRKNAFTVFGTCLRYRVPHLNKLNFMGTKLSYYLPVLRKNWVWDLQYVSIINSIFKKHLFQDKPQLTFAHLHDSSLWWIEFRIGGGFFTATNKRHQWKLKFNLLLRAFCDFESFLIAFLTPKILGVSLLADVGCWLLSVTVKK